jgi:hypothetical protein
MEKEQILSLIQRFAKERRISRSELLSAYEAGISGADIKTPEGTLSNLSSPAVTARGMDHTGAKVSGRPILASVLYYIGGGIVVIGISILVGLNWDSLSGISRIMVTLGVAVLAYVSAVLSDRGSSYTDKFSELGFPLHLIAGLLMPLGIFVTLHTFGVRYDSPEISLFISLGIFLWYVFSVFLWRRSILAIFAILFGTWAYYSGAGYLLAGRPIFIDLYEYLAFVLGLSYLALAIASGRSTLHILSGWLYTAGSAIALGAVFALGGFSPTQNIFWELAFPAFVFAVFLMSAAVRSRALLVVGSIYLVVYIGKITQEYFTDSLGWPVSLVVAGLSLIAVGYGAVKMNRKYIS